MPFTPDELAARVEQLEAALTAAAAERDAALAEVERLRGLVPGAAAAGIPVAEFRRLLAGVYYKLGTLPDAKQRQWDRVLSLLDGFTLVYPAREPVAGLLAAAVADGLLSAAEAAALRGER